MMKANNFSEYSKQNPKGIVLYYFMLLYRIIKSSWVLIPIFFTSSKEVNYTTILISLSILLVVLLIISVLMYLNFQFKVEDNHFILKQGVLNKSNTSIAFERIQNINFKQNLLQQIIGVTQVEIETAGGKKTEVSVKALSRDKAIALKEFILKEDYLLNKTADKEEIKVKKKYLIKISLPQLAKVAITENHFKSLGIAIALYFSITSQMGEYFKSFKIENIIDGAEDFIIKNPDAVSSSFTFIVSLIIVAIVLSLIVSTVIVFLFHFDLTLSVKKDALEINQGLLTKRNNILKKEKVQYIIFTSNPLKKIFRINSINFKQATSERVKKKKQIRVVGSKKAQNEVLKELLFGNQEYDNLETFKPAFYYIYQLIMRNIIFICLLNLVLFFGFESPNYIIVNSIIVILSTLMIYLNYKKSYFKINKDMLVKGSGKIETQTTFFEYFKIQNIKLKQTIFQKRAGVMNLVLQTASGKLKIPCIPIDEAYALYNHILKQAETSRKEWI